MTADRSTVIVLAGGPGRPAAVALSPGAIVIAADSGAEHAPALGLRVDLAVGDFDSITPAALAALERAGTAIERHPVAKDESDLELALTAALRSGPDRVVVLGGADGRLDHSLGELLLLASDAFSGVLVDAQLGTTALHVVRGRRALAGRPGEPISLFALHGPARGVVTEGLVYPLRDEVLAPGSTRGLSNAFAGPAVRISVADGVVLALRPEGRL